MAKARDSPGSNTRVRKHLDEGGDEGGTGLVRLGEIDETGGEPDEAKPRIVSLERERGEERERVH